jgi:hypothetical protein
MKTRLDRLPRIVRLSLINFYLIDREDIAIDGNTAFLGPNRSGKSSNIDAIQTALTGGRSGFSVYNAAAVRQNRPDAHRSLREYCLGVVQHDENEKARVMRRTSLTWIALSFRKGDGTEMAGAVQVNANEARERVDTRFMIVTGGGVTTSDLVFSRQSRHRGNVLFERKRSGVRDDGRELDQLQRAVPRDSSRGRGLHQRLSGTTGAALSEPNGVDVAQCSVLSLGGRGRRRTADRGFHPNRCGQARQAAHDDRGARGAIR